MVLICEEDNELKQGKQGCDREVWIGGELKNRRYFLYVKVEWNAFPEKEIIISAYGEMKLQIKTIAKKESLLRDCFI
jgi:hypothetical protein